MDIQEYTSAIYHILNYEDFDETNKNYITAWVRDIHDNPKEAPTKVKLINALVRQHFNIKNSPVTDDNDSAINLDIQKIRQFELELQHEVVQNQWDETKIQVQNLIRSSEGLRSKLNGDRPLKTEEQLQRLLDNNTEPPAGRDLEDIVKGVDKYIQEIKNHKGWNDESKFKYIRQDNWETYESTRGHIESVELAPLEDLEKGFKQFTKSDYVKSFRDDNYTRLIHRINDGFKSLINQFKQSLSLKSKHQESVANPTIVPVAGIEEPKQDVNANPSAGAKRIKWADELEEVREFDKKAPPTSVNQNQAKKLNARESVSWALKIQQGGPDTKDPSMAGNENEPRLPDNAREIVLEAAHDLKLAAQSITVSGGIGKNLKENMIKLAEGVILKIRQEGISTIGLQAFESNLQAIQDVNAQTATLPEIQIVVTSIQAKLRAAKPEQPSLKPSNKSP